MGNFCRETVGETDFSGGQFVSTAIAELPSEHTNRKQTAKKNKSQPQIQLKPETYLSFAENGRHQHSQSVPFLLATARKSFGRLWSVDGEQVESSGSTCQLER